MATKGKRTGAEKEVGEIVSRTEHFIENNQKMIIYAIIAVTVVVGAYLGFHYGYSIPKAKKADIALFKGEHYFAKDSFALALNGNGADFDGFEALSKDFSGTASGNLAKAYAGICYFKLGENDKAIDRLKSFSAKDGMVSPSVIGLIGDCYVNAGKVKEGIGYFEKAAGKANNALISPIYLKKAGLAYESLNQYKDAVKSYTEIKESYFNSREASDIDKYIVRATELSK